MGKANDFMLQSDRDLITARFEKHRIAWEKKRRLGKAFFVLTETVKLGGAIALFNILWDLVLERPKLRSFDSYFWGGCAICLLCIIMLQVWEWNRNEKRFR